MLDNIFPPVAAGNVHLKYLQLHRSLSMNLVWKLLESAAEILPTHTELCKRRYFHLGTTACITEYRLSKAKGKVLLSN